MKWTQESKVWLITLIVGLLGIIESKVGVVFPTDWLPYIGIVSDIVALVGALLKISPLPREKWTQSKRLVENGKKIGGMILVLAFLPFMQGCHGPINIRTNPVGAVAHYGKQVADTVQAVQDAVVAAEIAKVPGVTVERIAPVVRASIFVGREAQNLADALVELDALPIGDLSRPTKTKAIGVILATMNALIFNMVVPVGDDPLLIKIRDLVREVSILLLTVQQQLVPPPVATLHTGEWPASVRGPGLCPAVV